MMSIVTTPAPPSQDWDRGGLRELYQEHRWSLVRLASLLLHDPHEAEEIVQDAFVQAHLSWDQLRDPTKRLAYLRSAVLNGARSRLRHRKVVGRYHFGPGGAAGAGGGQGGAGQASGAVAASAGGAAAAAAAAARSPSPEAALEAADDRRRVMAALRSLPERQRECLVLRYYLDLSEAEIAATIGISVGSVKTHAHRGLAALAARLEAR